MELKTVHTDAAPKAIGPYAQALRFGNFLFTSGQIPLDPATGEMVSDEIGPQTERVFENLKAVLAAEGADLSRVLKATVYLADMNDFPAMNEVYARHFGEHKPARSTVEVARLPKDSRVEIDLVVAVG